MSKIRLISEKTLKALTILPDNLDSQFISQAVTEAQEIHLQELIGTRLLDKLCDLVKTDDIQLDGNKKYKNLLDEYITPYLCYRVLADIQIPLFSKDRNLGVINTNDTNTNSIGLKDTQSIMQFYQNKSSFFANRLSKYLCNNHSLYPEYEHCNCDEDFGARRVVYIPTVL